jgi:hypothetical protein
LTSAVHSVTVDCASPALLGRFWAAVLGGDLELDPVPADDDWAAVTVAAGPRYLFLKVPEPKAGKNRLHLDLTPSTTREEEVTRLAALGAVRVADFTEHGRWTVMADPEGNEFCVERSPAEKQADGDQHDE